MNQALIQAAAKKAGVKPALIAAFPATKNPDHARPGLYLRQSKDTGEMVWAYWNGQNWGLYSDTPKRAMTRRNKRSKKALPWFGYAKAPAR
jgi:hypothetical protein